MATKDDETSGRDVQKKERKKKQNKDLNPKQNSMGNLCKAQDGSGWIYDTPF